MKVCQGKKWDAKFHPTYVCGDSRASRMKIRMVFLFKGCASIHSASIQLWTSSSQWDRWLGRKDTMSEVLFRRKVNPLTLAQSWLNLGVVLSDSWLPLSLGFLYLRAIAELNRLCSSSLSSSSELRHLCLLSPPHLMCSWGSTVVWPLNPSSSRLSHWVLSWCRTSGDFTRDGGQQRTIFPKLTPPVNKMSQ